MTRATVRIGPISTIGPNHELEIDTAAVMVGARLGSLFMAGYPAHTTFRSYIWVVSSGFNQETVVGSVDTNLSTHGSLIVKAN
jgi:hypothetical protein